jgi:hypothetical protein
LDIALQARQEGSKSFKSLLLRRPKDRPEMNKQVRQAVLIDEKACPSAKQLVQAVKQSNGGDSFHVAVGYERGRSGLK